MLRASILSGAFAMLALAPAIHAQNCNVAYLIDSSLDTLFPVDLTNGATSTGPGTANNGLSTPGGLAWRDDTSTLWTIDNSGGEVGTLDPATGTFTVVQNLGESSAQSLAWCPTTSSFFSYFTTSDTVQSIDPVTGATSTILSTTDNYYAMDVDPLTTLLNAIDLTGNIVTIDKLTGATTSVSTTITSFYGMVIDANGRWHGTRSTDDSVYTIDPITGNATLAGGPSTPGLSYGIEVVTTITAATMTVGSGCVGSNGTTALTFTGRPVLGSAFSVDLSNGAVNSMYGLLFGLSDPNLDLGIAGMPGCFMHTDGLAALGGTTDGSGNASVNIGVPNDTALCAAWITSQYAVVDPPANPTGATTSNGGVAVLGDQ